MFRGYRIEKTIGFSLLEVMLSLLLLSFVLFALNATQFAALRAAKSAYYYSVANNQISNMVSCLSLYQDRYSPDQLTLWNQQNTSSLPNGRGQIEGHYPHYKITLYWGKQSISRCEKNQIGETGCITTDIELAVLP